MTEWKPEGGKEQGDDFDQGLLTERKQKVKKPSLFKILLHNDDFTTMEFVVFVLKTVFHKSEMEAVKIMLNVHEQGVGIAGIYTYEVAEAKINKVTEISQANDFPLLCTMEEE